MSRRGTALVTATILLTAWAICGLSYVSVPPGDSGGLIPLLVFIAAALTIGAAAFAVAQWRGQMPAVAALTLAGLAAAVILLIAMGLQFGNH
jgi:hypothetical protein